MKAILRQFKNWLSKPKETKETKHPQSELKIELAFEIEGEKFYRFADLDRYTSYGRWFSIQEYLQCLQYRVTPDLRNDFFDFMQQQVQRIATEPNATKRSKLSSDSVLAIRQYMSRVEYMPDSEILLNITARLFFKKEDDLSSGLDQGELKRRIELLKKKGLNSIILEKPLLNIIGLPEQPSLSGQELTRLIQESETHLRSLSLYMKNTGA